MDDVEAFELKNLEEGNGDGSIRTTDYQVWLGDGTRKGSYRDRRRASIHANGGVHVQVEVERHESSSYKELDDGKETRI